MPVLTFPIRGELLTMTVETSDHVAHVQSEFQTIDIYNSVAFGKLLFLDGHIQLSDLDERAYHECLVRPALLNSHQAKRVLVVGGGDGGAIRELCRFESLECIDMVEIDAAVIDTCRKHMPSLSDGAFDDPRVHVHVGDAFPYVKAIEQPYDVIVLDSTDTYEDETGELSEALFTREFYEDCSRALVAGGYVVTQADNPVFCRYSLDDIIRRFGEVFPVVGSYLGLVPSFGGYSAFAFATSGTHMATAWQPGWQRGAYLGPETYALAMSNLSF